MIGNAVPVNLADALAKKIRNTLNDKIEITHSVQTQIEVQ
jgi:hypothetical protein